MSKQNLTKLNKEDLDKVISFLNDGDSKKAIKSVNALINRFPKNALLYNFQGVCYEAEGNLDFSIASFKRAVLLNPNYAEAFYNLGVIQNKLGEKNNSVQSYKEAILIKPKYPDAQNNLGHTLSQIGKPDEALIHLNMAVNQNPNFAEAYNNIGLTYIELNETNNAIKSFKKAISLNPYFSRVLINLGHLYQEIGQFDLALKSYKKLFDINPQSGEALLYIGILYKHIGNHEKAVTNFEKALSLNPKLVNAYYELSNNSQYELSSKQLSSLESLRNSNNLSQSDEINLNFTLAKAFENNDDNRFVEFLFKANKLRKRQINYSIDNDIKRFEIFKKKFNSSALEISKQINKLSIKQKPIFIVGMPRSGSTLVEQILSSHNRVYGAGELQIFRKNLKDILKNFDTQSIKKIRKKYLNSIGQINFSEDTFTDKSLLNFQYIGLIIKVFPEAKIIHVKRDSKAICWSSFKTNFSQKGLGFSNDLDDLVKYYKLYENQMIFWQREFPNKIYDLQYETLTSNQAIETKKLLEYCNLEWDENCLHFYKNKRSVKTASTDQVRKKMYSGSSEAWKKYKKYIKPLIEGLKDTQ